MSIHTWVTKVSGRLTNRMTVRISHDLSLSELVDGLAAAITLDDQEELPDTLSAKKIREMVRDSYAYYGTNAVWAWADCEDETTVERTRAWCEARIIEAFPAMGEHRG